jgi:hypothetical protein
MSLGMQMLIAVIIGIVGIIGRYLHPGPLFDGALAGGVIVFGVAFIRYLIAAVTSR